MIDYHIHPDYSVDAEKYSMEDYCQRALQIGLKEICFTTHCEFDSLRKHLDWFIRCDGEVVSMHPESWLENYFTDAEKCQKIYAPLGLGVKVGLEAGYDLGLEKDIEAVLNRYPFDFVLGSVHCLDHVAISSGPESGGYYEGKELCQVAEAYYRTLCEAIETGLFDVIGHLDIYRRHGSRFFGRDIDTVFQEYIEKVFNLMLKTGTGIELNTSSLRHGQGNFYPGEIILKEAVRAGIKRFTVGSDCHRLGELGQGITQAIEAAHRYGVNFSVFEKRIPHLF